LQKYVKVPKINILQGVFKWVITPVLPRPSEVVGNAITSLKEPGGFFLKAIKKYIATNYKVGSE
jgi:hypothetical protein